MLPNLCLWYIIKSQNVLWRNGIVVFKVKVTANLWMLMNVCPDNISWIAEPFTTKLGMVMHHYEPDCPPKRLVCCLQDQGHNEGSCNQNMTFVCWIADPFATKLGLMIGKNKLSAWNCKKKYIKYDKNVSITHLSWRFSCGLLF